MGNYWSSSFSKIDPDLQTPESVKIAVEKYAYDFKYVRKELQTPQLIKFAVEKYPDNIKYVREDWLPFANSIVLTNKIIDGLTALLTPVYERPRWYDELLFATLIANSMTSCQC